LLTPNTWPSVGDYISPKVIKTDQTRNGHDMLSSLVSPNNRSLLKPVNKTMRTDKN